MKKLTTGERWLCGMVGLSAFFCIPVFLFGLTLEAVVLGVGLGLMGCAIIAAISLIVGAISGEHPL